MGAVRLVRTLVPLALVAALSAACGSNSSSSPSAGQSSGLPATVSAAHGAFQARPVYARYAPGVPLGDPQLGPAVPKDLVNAMKSYPCSAKPQTLQGMLMLCDAEHTVFLLKDPIIAGNVASAEPLQIGHSKLWYIKLAFDQQGASTLKQTYKAMPGTMLAFVLKDKVLSSPVVDSSMTDGHIGITGNFDEQQAKQLAAQLSAG
jgi:hypothetical protein